MSRAKRPPENAGRPRVLMFGPDLEQRGGIAAVLNAWVDGWDSDRFELRRVATYDSHLGSLPDKLRPFPRAVLRTVRELLFHRPDLAHVHFSWRGSLYRKGIFLILLLLFRIRPIILHCHAGRFYDYYLGRGRLLRAYIRWFVGRADHVLAVSEALATDLRSLVPDTPVQVMRNPVPPSAQAALRTDVARIRHCRAQNGPPMRSLTLGDVCAAKGSLDIVEVAERLVARGVPVTFELGGDGDVERLREAARERGVGSLVRSLGWLGAEAKDRAFRDAEVFLLPSYMEGFPVSVVEAMAYGVPVVSTAVGGIPELVRHGETGILCGPGDVQEMARALEALARDPELRRRMGEAGRERVVELCSPTGALDRLMALYDGLLRGPIGKRSLRSGAGDAS